MSATIVLGHALTDAQQRFLLSLPADGSWKRTSSTELESYGKNALRGFGQTGLVEGHYHSPMQHRLTKAGIEVVSALQSPNTSGKGAGQ